MAGLDGAPSVKTRTLELVRPCVEKAVSESLANVRTYCRFDRCFLGPRISEPFCQDARQTSAYEAIPSQVGSGTQGQSMYCVSAQIRQDLMRLAFDFHLARRLS